MLTKERQLMAVQHLSDGGLEGGALGAAGGYGGKGGLHGTSGFAGASSTLQGVGGWRPGVGGIMQRPYAQDKGFCVFWDYLLGLPKRSGSRIIGKVCWC